LKKNINLYDKILVEKTKQSDKSAFSTIFSNYYRDLVMFAFTFVKDKDVSEEIVEDIFVKFWEERENIIIFSSLKSYLLKSVQNKCLDWLRHLQSRNNYVLNSKRDNLDFSNDTENYILWSELDQSIDNILLKLPEEVALTFRMNRFEGLIYSEIAIKLEVSVRTVEVRIGKALQLLRENLQDYFIILFLLFATHLTINSTFCYFF